MSSVQFRLLIWKNYHLRKYHWIVTIFEFFFPIVAAILLVLISYMYTGDSIFIEMNATVYPPISNQNFFGGVNNSNVTLLYAPKGPPVDDFIDQIRSKFNRSSSQGFANETELDATLKNGSEVSKSSIGIFFKNIVSNQSLPDKLNYVLKIADKFNTKQLYDDQYTPLQLTESLSQNVRYLSRFAPVQLLINYNFIELKTNRSPSYEIEFEWFPFPEYYWDSTPRLLIPTIVGVLVIMVVLIVSIPLIKDIIEEKESGVEELMKMSGLDEWKMWLAWFLHALIISLVSFSIVSIILTYPFYGPGSELISFVPFFILWLFMILYCVANISFCFAFLSMFHNPVNASSMFLISICVFVCLLILGIIFLPTDIKNIPFSSFIALIPVGAFITGGITMQRYETSGVMLTWSSVLREKDAGAVSLSFCLLMLVFDTFLYLFLAFYITSINPGKFGIRKSPSFLFQRLFSLFSKVTPVKDLDNKVENEFMEPPPANVEPIIRIKDLHKNYGKVHAIRGVNLNIYPGEMTALLGRNGAGKTTTLSIMSGLTSPSAGSVYFKKENISKSMKSYRQMLGVCPQENRTMPYFTVIEHLLFFGELRGSSRNEVEVEADYYLDMMEMKLERNSSVEELPFGIKRKLCLSIALMGKAKILVLDEPTFGMDAQSRKKAWNLLLELRRQRSIIFTTHYMEEADALGERIAIMNKGIIVCHGTPPFLKKVYDTGFELTITKSKASSSSDGIDRVIKNALPAATRELETTEAVVYKLPLSETNKFPDLFKNLETGTASLGIEHISIGAITMEHVFLKADDVSMYASKLNENNVAKVTDDLDKLAYKTGLSLFIQQVAVLIKKKYFYMWRNLFTIFARIILPTLVGMFLLSFLRKPVSSQQPSNPVLDLSMSTYNGSTVLLSSNFSSSFEALLSEYVAQEKGVFIKVENTSIEPELLDEARNISNYNKNYITAFELLSSFKAKLLSNPSLVHSLPITITTYSNVILRLNTNNTLNEIKTFNHPLEPSDFINTPSGSLCYTIGSRIFIVFWCCLWFFFLTFLTMDLTSHLSAFVNMERIYGFRHIQTMSKVSSFAYWFSTLVFDVLFLLVVTGVRIGLYKLIERSDFLGWNTSLGVFAYAVTMYAISGLLFLYAIIYLFGFNEGSFTYLFIFNLTCGIVTVILNQILPILMSWPLPFRLLYYIPKGIILIIPSLNFSSLFIKLMSTFQSNTACTYCSEQQKSMCEAHLQRKPYLDFAASGDAGSLFSEMLFLHIDIVLYGVLLLLTNTGYGRVVLQYLKNLYGTHSTITDQGDDDVLQEYKKILEYKMQESKKNQVALLVEGLRKNYTSCGSPVTVVSNVSFIVETGTCFGLLGKIGAGKSTALKMLTAEITPTLGDSSIQDVKLSKNASKYLSMAGYCSQTNSIIEEFTGREMIEMIVNLRGLTKRKNKALVDKWIKTFGLEEFQNERSGTYSGGNKRKLCVAMALIGNPEVVFLDEPTTGVDPIAKLDMYRILKQNKKSGQAVILTSQSMKECEILCDRMTIMVNGIMKCIGTKEHLKKLYAQGFSVLINIKDISEEEKVHALKTSMSNAFSEKYTILNDQHEGLLYYQIKNTSLPWSTLFETMETIKNSHQELIDDYTITDATSEEIFTSFVEESSSYLLRQLPTL